ncbi:MAG: hypothetical protein CMO80_23945 [Verrucomicrobiales bacterium]|nr:hypothetical protein [Verrucomicrobiales bacterium]|tara:strand:- start:12017 stop:13099 length:1083 start_codon:yes stop_codon:yes gene_type:complete
MGSSILLLNLVIVGSPSDKAVESPKPQYEHGETRIPAASAGEPKREFSLKHAEDYLTRGAEAWAGQKKCVSCHTTAYYLQTFPRLHKHLGKPSKKMRDFFVAEFEELKGSAPKKFERGTSTAQVVYIAAGLAQWDRHITGKLSSETRAALDFMFDLQLENGTWQSLACWPPYESSAYQEATVALSAVIEAPGWLDAGKAGKLLRLKRYLRENDPPHDYARVLLLRAGLQSKDLLDDTRRGAITKRIWELQRADGGWSIRSFAKPDEWGDGDRTKKLQREPEFKNPPSDGHMTGLCVSILRDAGVPSSDPRIKKAVSWLLNNQRESGRWWTRSLNTDKYHFITYSGTCYPLIALAKCGELD